MNFPLDDSTISRLTSRRQPSQDELDERLDRAILKLLRHGEPSQRLICDSFGLFRFDATMSHLKNRIDSLADDEIQQGIKRLIAVEKIEIRGDRIRALYGHSIRGIIVGQMKWPEVPLFHATSGRHLDSIFKNGLRPQGRTWVHLTSQIEYADRIFKQHSFDGPAVLLQIDARRLEDHDVTFRQPNSHVWLANYIPPVGIEICGPNDRSETACQD